jgi:hypothetical protein
MTTTVYELKFWRNEPTNDDMTAFGVKGFAQEVTVFLESYDDLKTAIDYVDAAPHCRIKNVSISSPCMMISNRDVPCISPAGVHMMCHLPYKE